MGNAQDAVGLEVADLVTKQGLLQRGWTEVLVRDFLGEPDGTKRNPRYAKAAPMKLYSVARVAAAEGSAEFAAAKGKSAKRSVAAKIAAEAQRLDLLRRVQAMVITVDAMPVERVRCLAKESYEMRKRRIIEPSAPEHFIDRISVNFVRHHLTVYDLALEKVARQVGVQDAAQAIRAKVYAAIAATYPAFAFECQQQAEMRGVEMTSDR